MRLRRAHRPSGLSGLLTPPGAGRGRGRALLAAAAAVAGPALGVALYVQSAAHARHDPVHALQQLDLLNLDEPAPGADRLGTTAGRVTVVVFCPGACRLPDVERATVVRSDDPGLAAAYGLGAGGRTGFALVDADRQVRYRSYDPRPHAHEQEVQTLVDGLVGR